MGAAALTAAAVALLLWGTVDVCTAFSGSMSGFWLKSKQSGVGVKLQDCPTAESEEGLGEAPVRRVETVDLGGRGIRVTCLSDLHTDYKQNLQYVKDWPREKSDSSSCKPLEAIVVPGDISSRTAIFKETMESLKDKYDEVFVIPGNHDLWVEYEFRTTRTSVDKNIELQHLCKELGVRTDPVRFTSSVEPAKADQKEGGGGQGPFSLWIVPLMSWYHPSWDQEPDLPTALQHRNGDFTERWVDFYKCKWPASLCSKEGFVSLTSTVERDEALAIAKHFSALNTDCMDEVLRQRSLSEGGEEQVVISFSHFLPRKELIPEKRFLLEPNLPRVVGSAPLMSDVAKLQPDMHCYGHTHIPYDALLDGVRYTQWPLGSVREQTVQCRPMREHGPCLLFSRAGRGAPALDGEEQQQQSSGFPAIHKTFWGEYYSKHERDTTVFDVPDYAMGRRR